MRHKQKPECCDVECRIYLTVMDNFHAQNRGACAALSLAKCLLSAFPTAEFAVHFEVNARGNTTHGTIAEGKIRYAGMIRTETAYDKLSR